MQQLLLWKTIRMTYSDCVFLALDIQHAKRRIISSVACQVLPYFLHTRVGTLIVATIYLQLIQNRYMFLSFTDLHCSHQHCLQPVASDVKVVGYL